MRTFDVVTSRGYTAVVTVEDNEQIELDANWFLVKYGPSLGRIKAGFFRPVQITERERMVDEPVELPQVRLWEGRRFDELLPAERIKAYDFIRKEYQEGRMEACDFRAAEQELREAQRLSICPQASDGKHHFSSQGCPAGMQACLDCEEIEL